MITVGRRLILAGLIVVTLQIWNVSTAPTEKTISQLMMSSGKVGLVNYFKDLNLDNFCNFPLLDVKNFTRVENEYTFPCFCTVIYNISNEFEYGLINATDLEAAKLITNNHKFNDESMYNMWTNMTKNSESMKLLMDPLNSIDKWNKVCYNLKNELHTYCKFLNVEVLLIINGGLEKSNKSIKKNIDNPSKDLKEPVVPSVVVAELKTPEDLPQVKIDKSLETEKAVDNIQKIVEVNNDNNNNDEELRSEMPKDNINFDDDETTIEDEKPVEETETQTPIDSKPNSKSSVDYPKEDDGTIHQTETKESVSRLGPKPIFTNHGFGDTEDSHFLFYFSIMTILSMLFYLALYNKKKIIALLIEGRRSTNHRRRPNTASYSKVETDDGSTVF
ncbi:uncharacterized protein LOC132917038 [Rhopalosiphum padi]|uniref:uncharacterized protein LOC132917038 n=1 Tax=Rhopalosiphum padi TaxID=40932 RepID=UPI00298E2E37|nr:uncharacterized protein LOC132917038 [Rhopalosiphum padi]